jgi:hypothetical protein
LASAFVENLGTVLCCPFSSDSLRHFFPLVMIMKSLPLLMKLLLTYERSKVLYILSPFGARKNSDRSALLSFLPLHHYGDWDRITQALWQIEQERRTRCCWRSASLGILRLLMEHGISDIMWGSVLVVR